MFSEVTNSSDTYILLVMKQSSCNRVENCFNFVGNWSQVQREGLVYLTNHGRDSLLSEDYFADASSCRSSNSIGEVPRLNEPVQQQTRLSHPISRSSAVHQLTSNERRSEPLSASPAIFRVPAQSSVDTSSQCRLPTPLASDPELFGYTSALSDSVEPLLNGKLSPKSKCTQHQQISANNSESDIPCAQPQQFITSSSEHTDTSFILDNDESTVSIKVATHVFALKDKFYYPGIVEPSSRTDMLYVLFDNETRTFVDKSKVLFFDFPPVGTIIQADARMDGHYLGYQQIIQHLSNERACRLRNTLTNEEFTVPRNRIRLTEEMVLDLQMLHESRSTNEGCTTPRISELSVNNILSGKRIRREKTLRDSWLSTPPSKTRRTPTSSNKKIKFTPDFRPERFYVD